MAGDAPQLRLEGLREQVESILRGWLVTGYLSPGGSYTIRGVADELGVSPTPVREAVVRLVSDGLLTISRSKGFSVVELDQAARNEILFIRLLLEVGALERLAGHLSEDRAAYYAQLIDQMAETSDDPDSVTTYLAQAREFHVGLVGELGMPRLAEMVGGLRDRARLTLDPAERRESGNEEHRLILDALVAGDRKRVRELMVLHLTHHTGSWIGQEDDLALFDAFLDPAKWPGPRTGKHS